MAKKKNSDFVLETTERQKKYVAEQEAKGGGLDVKHWSASGYGETDPIAGTVENQSKDDRQKNRRVELVLQPNVEEMLNLKSLATGK